MSPNGIEFRVLLSRSEWRANPMSFDKRYKSKSFFARGLRTIFAWARGTCSHPAHGHCNNRQIQGKADEVYPPLSNSWALNLSVILPEGVALALALSGSWMERHNWNMLPLVLSSLHREGYGSNKCRTMRSEM